jgi:hypothetical protein
MNGHTALGRTRPRVATFLPSRNWLLGLFVLGLIPRLVILAARGGNLDFLEYETLAQNIVAGHGYVISRFGNTTVAFGDGNLYSFVSASVYFVLGHQPIVLAVIQAVIASLAAPVIFAVGARAFARPVAGLGAAMAALHPGVLAYTTKLHPLGLDVLLLAMMLWWVGRAGKGMRNGLLAGLALGLGLMSRPTFFLAGLVAMAVRWRAARSSLKPLLAAIAVALVIAAPWVMRNWVLLGRPVFVSTSLEDVWKGNNPLASGSSYLPSGQDIFSAASPELQARFRNASELGLNDVFAQQVQDFVVHQPGQFAGLVARKFVYFWWLSPQAGMLYPAAWLTAYETYATVILAFAAAGVVAILRGGSPGERNLLGMLAATSLTLAVIHALAYVEGRHRWGIEPLLLLLTARGIFSVASSLWSPGGTGQLRLFRRASER